MRNNVAVVSALAQLAVVARHLQLVLDEFDFLVMAVLDHPVREKETERDRVCVRVRARVSVCVGGRARTNA